MKLNDLKPAAGSTKSKKRLGRGPGSGHGKTSAKGHKGQASRSGGTKAPWFEGGQQPLTRRVPKRGFTNIFRQEYSIVNLERLEKFDADAVITPQILHEAGVIKKKHQGVKILSDGALSKALVVSAHKFSKKSIEKIEAAGGRVEILS